VNSSDIKPGLYHSALLYHGYKVRVHVVHDSRVYFSRVELDGMSISSVESFRGIVRFPAIRLTEDHDRQGR
jgi:hypothetical protein